MSDHQRRRDDGTKMFKAKPPAGDSVEAARAQKRYLEARQAFDDAFDGLGGIVSESCISAIIQAHDRAIAAARALERAARPPDAAGGPEGDELAATQDDMMGYASTMAPEWLDRFRNDLARVIAAARAAEREACAKIAESESQRFAYPEINTFGVLIAQAIRAARAQPGTEAIP